MKAIYAFLFFVFIFSCKNEKQPALIVSHGKIFEILIVCDTNEIDKVKNLIQPMVNLTYGILPQEEKKFRFQFISKKSFLNSQRFQLFQNIIFINQHQAFGINPSLNYARVVDKWASPQLIQFIRTEVKNNALWNVIENESEMQNIRLINSRVESWKTDTLLNFNNKTFQYPVNFEKVKSKNDLYFVFRNEFKDGVKFIFMQKTKIKPDISSLIDWRNKAVKSIFSDTDSSVVVHDKLIKPKIDSSNTKTLKYALKGLWETRSDFKGGPFATYIFYDENQQEYLYADTFVFAPGKEKKTYMEELKAIIYYSFYF